jgi:hypothetical protein
MKFILSFIKWLSSLSNINLARTLWIGLSVFSVVGYIYESFEHRKTELTYELTITKLQHEKDSISSINNLMYKNLYLEFKQSFDSLSRIVNKEHEH